MKKPVFQDDINRQTQLIPFAFKAIHDFCERRDYRCKGCPYSPAKIGGDGCCIFADCPCSWDIEIEE